MILRLSRHAAAAATEIALLFSISQKTFSSSATSDISPMDAFEAAVSEFALH